jgi:hypothetical protein
MRRRPFESSSTWLLLWSFLLLLTGVNHKPIIKHAFARTVWYTHGTVNRFMAFCANFFPHCLSDNELQWMDIKRFPLFSLAISARRSNDTSSSVDRVKTAFTPAISFSIAACNFKAIASVTFLSEEKP